MPGATESEVLDMPRDRAKEGWLKVDRKRFPALLRKLRASETLVAAWLVDNMDSGDNKVVAPEGLVQGDDARLWFERRGRTRPSRATWAKCLRTLMGGVAEGAGDDGEPFVARVRTGLLMVNPAYLYFGTEGHGKKLKEEFDGLLGKEAQEPAKGPGRRGSRWMKVSWACMVELLAGLDGREGCVVASMLERMDGGNRVLATQDMLREGKHAVSQATVTKAMHVLGGNPLHDRNDRGKVVRSGLTPPFCIRLYNGCYLVNPSYAFVGSDDARDHKKTEFERHLRERAREARKRAQAEGRQGQGEGATG